LQGVSVLIDFQHMTDSQARRCIDYLDGARFVLDGNLKKISSTMWLLTPANVVVNIEDMGLRGEASDSQYDFDMKRR
ncbi:cell division protein SepF, partial [Streptococcus merionis]|uniref:cell division protein SepF n=1 Tax=Streptococcus merionis TaxID=400065 RepID=UPI0026F24F99